MVDGWVLIGTSAARHILIHYHAASILRLSKTDSSKMRDNWQQKGCWCSLHYNTRNRKLGRVQGRGNVDPVTASIILVVNMPIWGPGWEPVVGGLNILKRSEA